MELRKRIIGMHKTFGTNEGVGYVHRKGAYLVPIKDGRIGIIQTSKGFFLLGGGIDNGETDAKHPVIGYFHPIQTYYLGELVEQKQSPIDSDHKLVWMDYYSLRVF